MIYTHARNMQGFHALQKRFLHTTGTRSFAEGQLLLLTGELAIRFVAAHSMGGTQVQSAVEDAEVYLCPYSARMEREL